MNARRLLWLGLLLTLGVTGTGALVLLLPGHASGMLALLDGHVWMGWALAVLAPALLGVHLATTRSGWKAASLFFGLGLLLSIPAVVALDGGEDEDLRSEYERSFEELAMGDVMDAAEGLLPIGALLVLVVLTLALGVGAQLAPLARHVRSRWTGLALALLGGWATVTGAAVGFAARDSLFLAIGAHSLVGVAATLLFTHHVVASRAARAGLNRHAMGLGVLVATAVLGAGAWALAQSERGAPARPRTSVPGVMVGRTPATAAERASAVDPHGDWEPLPTSIVRDSESCGAAGCHATLTAEWSMGPHRYAASNALYRAATDALIAEGDLAGAQFCANCHDPERALTGRVATDYAHGVPVDGSDGVSCVVCHTMVSTGAEPSGNGLFTVAAVAADHLGPEGEPARRRIDRDARAHRGALGIDRFVISPLPCETCHRLELGPDHGLLETFVLQNQVLDKDDPANRNVMCQDCHLPVMKRAFDQYNHVMPGINADLAAYVPEDADAEALAAYSDAARNRSGAVPWGPIEAEGWPTKPDLRNVIFPDVKEIRPLSLRVRMSDRGDGWEVRLRTLNRRIGHDFPSGPLDLQEVWLEARVVDATGRVLLEHGGLDAEGRVRPDALRLGARELGPDGEPLRQHRLKDLRAVEDKRVLEMGGVRDDTLPVDVPDDAVFPLDVRVRWGFRRANPDFQAFAGLAEGAIRPWEVAAARIVVEAE